MSKIDKVEFMENENITITKEFEEIFQYYKKKYRIEKWKQENNIEYYNKACKFIAYYIIIYRNFNDFTQSQLETFLKWYYNN